MDYKTLPFLLKSKLELGDTELKKKKKIGLDLYIGCPWKSWVFVIPWKSEFFGISFNFRGIPSKILYGIPEEISVPVLHR